MTTSPAPDDARTRFSDVDDDHRGGILWITASLSMTYFVLSCMVRSYLARRQLTKDTIALVAATVIGFVQVMLVYRQLLSGYGTSIGLLTSTDVLTIQKFGFVANLLFIMALTLAKLSVVWFLERLTPNTTYLKLCTGLSALCALWGVAAVFAQALRCDLTRPWVTFGVQCPNLLLRWQLISAFDVVTEAILFALIVGLVFNLQMSFEKKFVVVCSFAFRLPLIMLAIVHAHYTRQSVNSTNATFDQITTSVIMSINLGWSLISATILCLKPFVVALGSGYLGATINHNLDSQANISGHSGGHSNGQGNAWSVGLSAKLSAGREETYAMDDIRMAWSQSKTCMDGQDPDSHVLRGGTSSGSVHRVSDDGSQELIIRRTAEYRVKYEENEDLKPDRTGVAS